MDGVLSDLGETKPHASADVRHGKAAGKKERPRVSLEPFVIGSSSEMRSADRSNP
jgi:hypothetical protein